MPYVKVPYRIHITYDRYYYYRDTEDVDEVLSMLFNRDESRAFNDVEGIFTNPKISRHVFPTYDVRADTLDEDIDKDAKLAPSAGAVYSWDKFLPTRLREERMRHCRNSRRYKEITREINAALESGDMTEFFRLSDELRGLTD